MACGLLGTKALPEPILSYKLDHEKHISMKFIEENAFTIDVGKMSAILYQPQCFHEFKLYLTNPTMHHANIPQCTILQQKCAHVHISVTKWCIVGY